MGAFTKRWIIRKRRTRRLKLDKLRKQYTAARSEADRGAIVAKAQQVSPQLSTEQFLGPIQRANQAG
jgi:hypothetical protein